MYKKLEIIIGKTAGFCYGVNNAVNGTKEILKIAKTDGSKVYCLGELVHNKQVIESLEKDGLKVVEELAVNKEKDKIKVIIRAHGVPPKVYKDLNERNYEIIDLTCPNVLAIHKIVKDYNGYVFIIGKKEHPESIGTLGFCKNANIIEDEEDIDGAILDLKKSNIKNLLVIVQTTFSLEKFNSYVNIIKRKLEGKDKPAIVVKNTICNATKLRQEETASLSKKVDYMIIIGGKNSSNTKKLYEIAKANCKNSICIETIEESEIIEIKSKIENIKDETIKIGIMAGASTPQKSIEDVKKYFTDFT